MQEIKNIYIGLPNDLVEKIYIVNEEYRTNPLSKIKGGLDIVIEYLGGSALLYNNIKNPYKYIKKVILTHPVNLNKDFSHCDNPFKRVFVKEEKYEEIWDSSKSLSELLDIISKYEIDIDNSMQDFHYSDKIQLKTSTPPIFNKRHKLFELYNISKIQILVKPEYLIAQFYTCFNYRFFILLTSVIEQILEIEFPEKMDSRDQYIVEREVLKAHLSENNLRFIIYNLILNGDVLLKDLEINKFINELYVEHTEGPSFIFYNNKRIITQVDDRYILE